MVSKAKVRSRVLRSWGHTLVSLLVVVLIAIAVIAISTRFAGARAVIGIYSSAALLAFITLLISESLVCLILQARRLGDDEYPDYHRAFKELWDGRRFKPRLYIIENDKPNAVAFGLGLFGQCGIAVTTGLYSMMNYEELKGVVAHESAHIRMLDVGLMTVMSVFTGSVGKLGDLLRGGKTAVLRGPIVLAFGWLIYVIGKLIMPIPVSAISHMREFSADTLGAYYCGTGKGLASALDKLARQYSGDDDGRESVLDDLFISHPKMGQRISNLKFLEGEN